ncbi:MAG: transposase [Pirellulaceae bacterium]|nr:MAG: transposase [Pirellulaceae bacterium]
MAHSLAKMYVHVVFSTKHRLPVLLEEWRGQLFGVFIGIARHIGCPALAVGGVADHVHLLLLWSRTISVAEGVGKIKSATSAWLNKSGRLPAAFHWQNGYGAFSIGQSEVRGITEYIRKQPEHHRTQSFENELREWLRRYEIEWDERYVWD